MKDIEDLSITVLVVCGGVCGVIFTLYLICEAVKYVINEINDYRHFKKLFKK